VVWAVAGCPVAYGINAADGAGWFLAAAFSDGGSFGPISRLRCLHWTFLLSSWFLIPTGFLCCTLAGRLRNLCPRYISLPSLLAQGNTLLLFETRPYCITVVAVERITFLWFVLPVTFIALPWVSGAAAWCTHSTWLALVVPAYSLRQALAALFSLWFLLCFHYPASLTAACCLWLGVHFDPASAVSARAGVVRIAAQNPLLSTHGVGVWHRWLPQRDILLLFAACLFLPFHYLRTHLPPPPCAYSAVPLPPLPFPAFIRACSPSYCYALPLTQVFTCYASRYYHSSLLALRLYRLLVRVSRVRWR